MEKVLKLSGSKQNTGLKIWSVIIVFSFLSASSAIFVDGSLGAPIIDQSSVMSPNSLEGYNNSTEVTPEKIIVYAATPDSNSLPVWAFNGAYANYTLVKQNSTTTNYGFVFLKINKVYGNKTMSDVTFNVTESVSLDRYYKTTLKNMTWSGLCDNFGFVNQTVLSQLNKGVVPTTVKNFNIKADQSIQIPSGTFAVNRLNGTESGQIIKIYIGTDSGIMLKMEDNNTRGNYTYTLSKTNIPSSAINDYNVTFKESGLPSGISWSVTLNGTKEYSTTSTVVFNNVTDGTYKYTVANVSGYTLSSSSGNIKVNGNNVTEEITFTHSFKLSPLEFYGIIGAVAAVGVIGAGLMFIKRKR
jgi:hypothetical protein